MLTQCLEMKARGCCMHVFLVILITLDVGNWENVLAKLRNPEPTMAQWNVTLATTKKTPKKTARTF